MMKTCRLPIELIDQSLEHISDKLTLSSCSLVCRSWLNGSRRVLFSTITIIANPGALALFVDFCQRTSESEANFPSARPCQHVRHLRIHPPGPRDGLAVPKELDPLSPHLEFILSRLEVLKSLELQCLKIHGIPRLAIPARLEELTLIGVWTASDTEKEILDLLCQLPSLRSLKFHGHKFTNFIPCRPSGRMPSPGDAAFPTNISRLSTLSLRHSKLTRYFMDIIALDPPVKSLRRLEITVLKESDLTVLGRLLDVLGANMCHLGLDMSEYLTRNMLLNSVQFDGLRMDTLTSLKSMTLYLNFYGEPWASLPLNSVILRNFSQLFSRPVVRKQLRVLTFRIGLDATGTCSQSRIQGIVRGYLLHELKWTLEFQESFPQLQEIRWEWKAPWLAITRADEEEFRESLKELVQRSYPGLNEVGLLRFSDTWHEF